MRGDVYEGEALVKQLGQHPDQLKAMIEKSAAKLKCKPSEVLDVLDGLSQVPKDLQQVQAALREAKHAGRFVGHVHL